ncbi:MAG: type II/IV secretion system protein [Planctomycetales bacterium]|nr:type II/IV secretion system protein [Planctomycetales bacterium]
MRDMKTRFSVTVILLIALLGSASVARTAGVKTTTSLTAVSVPASSMETKTYPFPRAHDRAFETFVDSYESPMRRLPSNWLHGIIKLGIVLASAMVWLRGLHVTLKSGLAQRHLRSIQSLFVIGLVGIVASLFVPQYPFVVGLLVASNVAPFIVTRSAWSRSGDESVEPFWRDFLAMPAVKSEPTPIKFEPSFFSNTSSQPVIRLVDKSSAEQYAVATGGPAKESPGYQMVLSLISNAVASRATDLHFNTKIDHVVALQRVDGSLNPLINLPYELGRSVINVFKVMSDLNIADRRRPQDGSFRVDVGERRLCLRVSAQGTQGGEKLSIRILDPAKSFSDFASLGVPPQTQDGLTSALEKNHGLILIVGATGAGKSTTACAALQNIDTNERNVISIEDPIEYQLSTVNQIEVNSRAGQSFDSVLRGVLRLDADVIFVGEIRDEETAKIACRAAMTGQLVIATLHSSDAVSGTLRLAELGVDIQNIANSIRAVLCQTLVRTLCPDCREAYQPTAEELAQLGIPQFDGVLYRTRQPSETVCQNCNDRGFRYRTGVFELLNVTAPIRQMIRERQAGSEVLRVSRENGMQTLRDEGIRLLCEGRISSAEFNRTFDEQ